MRDELSSYAARGTYVPLRKCEWCAEPAERGADLCEAHGDRWLRELTVPYEAGDEAEIVFGLTRAGGVLW